MSQFPGDRFQPFIDVRVMPGRLAHGPIDRPSAELKVIKSAVLFEHVISVVKTGVMVQFLLALPEPLGKHDLMQRQGFQRGNTALPVIDWAKGSSVLHPYSSMVGIKTKRNGQSISSGSGIEIVQK